MFQGATVDVVIGVVLLFLVTSLLASAVVEVVGGIFHRRSKNLWDTIDLMLGRATIQEGDDEAKLVDVLYRKPFITKLVQPKAQAFYPLAVEGADEMRGLRSYKSDLGRGQRQRRFHGPQHIASADFANAFIEAVRPGGHADTSVVELKRAVEGLPAEIEQPLGAALATVGDDFTEARTAIEDWYSHHMQSVSQWYRRQTRYFLFAAGLVFAVAGNLDAIDATSTLYRDRSVREAVVEQAQTISGSNCSTAGGADDQVECVRNELGGAVDLPVGWGDLDTSGGAWTLRVLGWLLVAGAVTLGAPFWFDLLRRALAHRKATSESN